MHTEEQLTPREGDHVATQSGLPVGRILHVDLGKSIVVIDRHNAELPIAFERLALRVGDVFVLDCEADELYIEMPGAAPTAS